MYENKKQKLASKKVFRVRILKNVVIAFFVMIVSLFLGIIGYKTTVPEFDWYDSLLNASMILSGMGPLIEANIILSKSAKVFASFYALFSGITFLTTFSIIIAPVLHRFFHKLHMDEEEN
jgi:hypothetical protein